MLKCNLKKKKEVIHHGDTLLKGPEDPRLFYHMMIIYFIK